MVLIGVSYLECVMVSGVGRILLIIAKNFLKLQKDFGGIMDFKVFSIWIF
jgi:hypothetical protein